MKLYAKSDRVEGPPFPVNEQEARNLDDAGTGVFHVVNEFQGKRRATNLTRINYWFCDLDDGTKQEQLELIEAAPLQPSMLIESAGGYHCYFRALDATRERWDRIERGLVEFFGADPKAKDPLRLLRAPGFFHWKAEPFLVTKVWDRPWAEYTEGQMLLNYPYEEPEHSTPHPEAGNESCWHVNALIGLPILSGTKWVNGEEFELRPTASGKHNVIRQPDGYSTGCFVDQRGLIGGCSKGNTLASWVRWYGFDSDECKAAIAYVKENMTID